MSIPKEPRQAMINMMYLVLTALLAINVSAEILNAFTLVEHSMTRTNRAINKNLALIYNAFKDKAAIDPSAQPLWVKAQKVKSIADSAYNKIENMKLEFLKDAQVQFKELEGGAKASTFYGEEDSLIFVDEGAARNTHATTAFFDESVETGKKKGIELQKLMNDVRSQLYSKDFIDRDDLRSRLDSNSNLKTKDGKVYKTGDGKGEPVSWSTKFFHEVPVVAGLAILSNIQNNIRTAEADVIDFLKSKIGMDAINFDQLKGRVITNKGYYVSGDQIEADIFVSASSSSITPKVYLGALSPACREGGGLKIKVPGELTGNQPPVSGARLIEADPATGLVQLKQTASGSGETKLSGVVEIKSDKTGKIDYYPFEYTYMVGKSELVVSPTAMNVLYAGIDNPMEVSVSGYPSSQVNASASDGSKLSRREGTKYTIVPNKSSVNKEISISATVTDPSGNKSFRSGVFRVKALPRAEATVSGYTNDKVKAAEARFFDEIRAAPSGFIFDVPYQVVGWEARVRYGENADKTYVGNTNKITGDLKDALAKARPNTIVNFDVKVKQPDGAVTMVYKSYTIVKG